MNDDQLDEQQEGAKKAAELEEKQPLPEVPPIEAEKISDTASKGLTLMTLGGGQDLPGRNMTVSTVSMVSAASGGQHTPTARVKVKIQYPEKWKKDKHFKDGDIKEVAPETADQFIKMGFATLVNESKVE